MAAIRAKKVKKGLNFSIMIVGASGLGKSTFVNTLCDGVVFPKKDYPSSDKLTFEKTVVITPVNVELDLDGVKLSLSVVDTPGFGDNINNEACFNQIIAYIDKQFDDVLGEESRIKRNPKFIDNRVHACLYFIPPTGHALRELDIEFMRKLGPKVNIIPVIAKADTLSPQELIDFKKRVVEDLSYYKIPTYSFPFDEEEDDEETIEENQHLRSLIPFSIIGADETITEGNRRIRCRQYQWGRVEVDNPLHCDFDTLRHALLISHLNDLKEITNDVLYENYRTEKLSHIKDDDLDDGASAHGMDEVVLQKGLLRREEERLRQELALRQQQLKNLEARLSASQTNVAE
ncbi:hypothetical protein HDU93_008163 [Gonapodya sp. JEL0774]|nr:hypothetical protein HDU93_008163 [Gonapodya sp. JEL0774]